MAISPYFHNYNFATEQNLLDDLIIESIKIYGMDFIYLPRHNKNYNSLYGTSDIVEFNTHYEVEMYLKSVDGFSGDGNFMSKFGLEIRDQITLVVAKKTFDTLVGSLAEISRPREGDLIYFPLNDKCFEIKFADNKPTFYQLGKLQVYNLTCELYEYSSEKFNTGIANIDKLENKHTEDVYNYTITTEDNFIIIDEDSDILEFDLSNEDNTLSETHSSNEDNTVIQVEADKVLNWTEKNPFAENGYI